MIAGGCIGVITGVKEPTKSGFWAENTLTSDIFTREDIFDVQMY